MDLQSLVALRKYITIEKHIHQGENEALIKLKFSLNILSDDRAMALVQENKHKTLPPAIIDSKLNLIMRTIQLKYDPAVISPLEFEELLTTKSRPRFEEIAEKYKLILAS